MRVANLIERDTGEVVGTFDLTGYWPSKILRFWDGLVMQVDFERFVVEPGLDELLAAAEVTA